MTLKLKFDGNLKYQIDAVDSIVNLFEGQPLNKGDFEVSFSQKKGELHGHLGIGNNLLIDEKTILENLRKVQDKSNIPLSEKLDGMNFSVEMETGTGKTYVYLRTIFELNKKYGFKKFIIVVPSLAIKEGVKKNLDITKEHFKKKYNNVSFNSIVYDSKSYNEIATFARSNSLQVLVMNIDSFRKTLEENEEKNANVFHRKIDKLGGREPAEFVKATRPIVIIDEPQSVDNTPKAQKAIETLNPLCTLRYSATHRNPYNMVYSLGPVKAYDLRLVKKIEVASLSEEIGANEPYIKLEEIDNSKGIRAKINILQKLKEGIKKKSIFIKKGTELDEASGGLDIYQNYKIADIDATPGNELLEFTNGKFLRLGQEMGGIKDEIIKAQIQSTVEEHLKKEILYRDKGIKVLSLFFIDRVSNYRDYTEDGKVKKGKFALWFEEAFQTLSKKPWYKEFIEKYYRGIEKWEIEKIHDGYFSQDKDGKWKDSREGKESQSDDDIYEKIMKNKEKLLSFEEPLRFIFSHSALREGWDNPNVFQICTLNESKSSIKKRQEIGRGLRLSVNQQGDRIFDDNINRLTVFANESYEDFVKALQENYEEDGIKFGIVEETLFKKIWAMGKDGDEKISAEKAKEIFEHLKKEGHISNDNKVTEKFDPSRADFSLNLPASLQIYSPQIIGIIKNTLLHTRIEKKSNKIKRKLNKEVFFSTEFKKLWEKISTNTTYSLTFPTEKLIEGCSRLINQMEKIDPIKINLIKVEIDINKQGIDTEILRTKEIEIIQDKTLPDILGYLQRETRLTRDTLAKILIKSSRLEDFKTNPQKFIDEIIKIISKELNEMIAEGVQYEKISGEIYEMQKLEIEEFEKDIDRLVKVDNSVYDYIEFDSEIEKTFAEEISKREDVKLFLKLPREFRVRTPVGDYNPDWAIVRVSEETGKPSLYLVRETKGSLDEVERRGIENQKIKCGTKHFKAIDVDFKVVTSARNI